jgi:GAF domain-containing protein
MKTAPIPSYEYDRICALEDLKILDTATEERFDAITKEATERFAVPISTITLVDKDREWFKSVQGLDDREGPRDISFCGHALISEIVLIVEDTLLDPRFSDNPMVVGEPNIRFYAGKSLYEKKSKLPVGVFCIKDTKPRVLSLKDIDDFLLLAKKSRG